MKVEGRCHCGQITYQAVVDPLTLSLCHCTDCQTLSGSPYRASVPAPVATFVLLSGKPQIYVKTADSGTKRAQAFCGTCGTPIYAAAPDKPTTYSLRLGAIKQRLAFSPARQIWCQSALPWAMDLSAIDKRDGQ
jgi:hypothetical protein